MDVVGSGRNTGKIKKIWTDPMNCIIRQRKFIYS
jgi:hypothetical protein